MDTFDLVWPARPIPPLLNFSIVKRRGGMGLAGQSETTFDYNEPIPIYKTNEALCSVLLCIEIHAG